MSANTIVVIGDRESALGFGALGAEVMTPAPEVADVRRAIGQALAGGAAVIFITEGLARLVPDTIADLGEQPLPSVVTIPDASGSEGTGLAALDEIIVRAVGGKIDHREEGE
jgi:V/A-type H+-transporting ATPase subunit F